MRRPFTTTRTAATVAACLAACLAADAHAAPPPVPPLESNKYMKYEDPKDWYVKYRFIIYPDARRVQPNNLAWTYPTLSIVAPFAPESAAAWLSDNEPEPVRGGLAINGFNLDYSGGIDLLRVPGTAAPYLNFRVDSQLTLRRIDVGVVARMTSVDTTFDERAAWDLPWPQQWPAAIRPWIERDPVYDTLKPDEPDPVKALLDRWTGGNDPHQVPPVQLAKYLTGCVLEHVRTQGKALASPVGFSQSTLADSNGEPYSDDTIRVSNLAGFSAGFVVENASTTAESGRGTYNDLANLLAAVLRRARIPARTVIGIDNEDTGDKEAKVWVEFAVVAPDLDAPLWIPIDVRELKKDGRSSRNWKQPWKHFGTSDMLRNTPPVAYHFHPPANYRSYNNPALCGIASEQPLPDYGAQVISLEVSTAPNRAKKP